MIVEYVQSGGHPPPPDREVLTVEDDGSFTMWRSIGSSVEPPSPVGRFSGLLDGATQEALAEAVLAVSPLGDLVSKRMPGAALVTIETGTVTAKIGIHDEPDNAWGPLAGMLSALLQDLTASPEAALQLVVSDDGAEARLRHLGSQPLELHLGGLTVEAVLWEGYANKGGWSAPLDTAQKSEPVQADGEWELSLPFSHGFKPVSGQRVVAYVTFEATHEGFPVPVSLDSA